jgi:hypothetical protein
MSQTFNHGAVRELYERVNSRACANLKTATNIKDYLLPYVSAVATDPIAYEEAITYIEFNPIRSHIRENELAFKQMNMLTSLCFTIWMNVYH